jgi:hypothetical protein
MVDSSVRRRIGVALILGILAVVLVLITSSDEPPHTGTLSGGPLVASVDSLVDGFLREQGIDRKKERKWSVRNRDGDVIRMERRVLVPPDLITLELNRALDHAVEPLGGHVAGTERTKESIVVLHVVVGGMTVHTLTLEHERKKPR